jgi:uncharacterized SAM-binding protein YcdF (DUF218 family)
MLIRLTQIIIWVIVGLGLFYILLKLIPAKWLAIFGGLVLFMLIVLAFWNPNAAIVPPTSQIVSVIFQPIGMSLLLISIGLTQLEKDTKIKKNGTILIGIGFFILLVSSLPIVAHQLAQQMETEVINLTKKIEYCPPICDDDLGSIVLLGRGTTEPALPYRTEIQLTQHSDRIFYAAGLYHQERNRGNDPIIIVSAGPRLGLSNQPKVLLESEDIRILLQRLGVPESRIILESKSVDLRTSVVEVKQILEREKLAGRPIFLVTSAINMTRAIQAFRKPDLYVFPRPTDFYTFQPQATPRRSININEFIPSVEALLINSRILEEFFGALYYFLRGWLAPII